MIVSDTDLNLEYLYVGDYGKENNIKADFLGYTKRIEKVVHKPVDVADKLVVTVSTQKGCLESCKFCDCPKFGFKGNVPYFELMSEIVNGIAFSKITQGERLNVHFARMGEPTWNPNVIKVARDIGNITIGYICGAKGVPWSVVRIMFDRYQGESEGISSQNAQRLGWSIGIKNFLHR